MLWTAAPASAHVYLGTDTAQAQSEIDLAFVIPHGCGDLATSALHVQMPDGAEAVDISPPFGFDGAIDDGVASFTGGDLPSGGVATFTVRTVLPDVFGRLHFPSVQECGTEEVRWLDIPGDGRADGQPAPSLVVTGGSEPTGEADEIPAEEHEDASSPVWPALAGLLALVGGGWVINARRGRHLDEESIDELSAEADSAG